MALAEISRAVVALHKRYYGKGPVKARSTLARNVLTVILEGGYTTAEETLAEHGAIQEIVSRLAMQSALEHDFRKAVETILYRTVRSLMSANDPGNDMQAEIFGLNPTAADELPDGADSVRDEVPAESSAAEESLSDRAEHAREDNRALLAEQRALRAEQHQARRALQKHTTKHTSTPEARPARPGRASDSDRTRPLRPCRHARAAAPPCTSGRVRTRSRPRRSRIV